MGNVRAVNFKTAPIIVSRGGGGCQTAPVFCHKKTAGALAPAAWELSISL